ncbi:MAG: hypothetical protein PUC57_05655 [Oscillospiraceae bacterium]|nr:hypothetical protein [Oscillospiraceae bacterium]
MSKNANQSKNNTRFTEFKLENWLSLVDCATVYSLDDIRFTFKHGQEVQA